MNKLKLDQSGVAHHFILIIMVVAAVIGLIAYRVSKLDSKSPNSSKKASSNSQLAQVSWPMNEGIEWSATGQGSWMTLPYDATPPACPDPLQLQLPTKEISKATSVLYPGQSRTGDFSGKGGTYKPHGGIRFDGSTNEEVSAVMPYDAYVFRGNRVTVDGEIQYGFDFINPCGIMVRLGHLRDLTPAFQTIADKLPAAIEGDSRTTKIQPMVAFKTGDLIATAVGFKTTKNVGFDYGVYDLRSPNEASKNSAYQAAHVDTAELSSHALCWLDLLSTNESKAVKALPAGDMTNGKTSDYCK